MLSRAGSAAKPMRDLLIIEIMLSVLGALSVYLTWEIHAGLRIHFLPDIVRMSQYLPLQPVDFSVISGQVICFAIGVLSGFELPLLATALEQNARHTAAHSSSVTPGGEHGAVLAANYIGTLFGTFIFVFGLGPAMSLGMAAWWTASINLVGAIVLYLFFNDSPNPAVVESKTASGVPIALGASLTVLAFVGVTTDAAEQLGLKATYYISTRAAAAPDYRAPGAEDVANTPEVVVRRSPYQTLHIVRPEETGSKAKDLLPGEPFTLYIDRHFQISSRHEGLYHEFFVHYPLSKLVKDASAMPRRVLVLGGGDGLAARELLRYPEIETIIQVELDPMMIELSRNHPAFRDINHDSQRNPRVQVVEGDAFTYLKRSREKFDAIFIDFPYPYSYDLSRLYSVEFYTFVNRNISENGFAVLDMPLVSKSDPNQANRIINDIFASTLHRAGFASLSPYGGEGQLEFDLETFMIARHKGDAALSAQQPLPRFPLKALNAPGIKHYGPADFELYDNPRLVNSIFRPALLSLRNTFL
jgi:spermidine synthase